MNRPTAALLCLLLSACVLGGCSSGELDDAELQELFDGVEAPVVAVQLEYSTSSSYEWTCSISDDSVLERRVGYIVKESGSSQAQAVFVLSPLEPGEVEVTFALQGDSDADAVETAVYVFVVDEDLNIKVKSRDATDGAELTVRNEAYGESDDDSDEGSDESSEDDSDADADADDGGDG